MKAKGQSAIEYLATYSWAIALLTAFLAILALVSLSQRPSTYTPSYCYISPELLCYQAYIAANSMGTVASVLFTNNLGVEISFPVNAFSVAPTYANVAYTGNCLPANALQGNTVTCTANLNGYTPTLGSQLNPSFTVSYMICGNRCVSLNGLFVYNTTGHATLSVSP